MREHSVARTAAPSLVVALDGLDAAAARRLAAAVRPHVSMVKVGLELFVAHGPGFVRQLREAGHEIFLDLKLHDIPRTAAAAAAALADLDVRLTTVHAAGGAAMLAAVRAALPPTTQVVAVTVLTSLDDVACRALGLAGGATESAARLGAVAMAAGADGLVCSAHELAALAPLGGLRVVPGVRAAGAAGDDQRRVATAEAAAAAGASYLVVGRPIVAAADPPAAAAALAAAIAAAQR